MTRTTIDLDPIVLRELKLRSKRERKSMGQVASELLVPALAQRAPEDVHSFTWRTWSAGEPSVDLEDKDQVWRILDTTRSLDGDS